MSGIFTAGELVLGMGDFHGHGIFMLGNELRVMRVCMEETELEREMWKERCCYNL